MSVILNGTTGIFDTNQLTVDNLSSENIKASNSIAVDNYNIGNLYTSYRNKIINGNFDIWQRGTSQTAAIYGSDDRWFNIQAGSTKTHSQQTFALGQTEVPGNPKYFSRTVVSSAAGVNNYTVKMQKLEYVSTLAGKTATLSFYAKADANKNIATEFYQYFGTGGSPSVAVDGIGVTTFALTTTWQKYTITVNIPSISGKTLGTNGDDSLRLYFWFDAGSTYNSRTNSLGQQSGTFDIAQVQLEEGSIATPFEERPLGLELSLCQRYYETMSITVTSLAGTTYIFKHNFLVQKRTTPTYAIIGGSIGTATIGNITSRSLRQDNLASVVSDATLGISAEL